MVLEGDIGAPKISPDRIAPPRRDAPVSLAPPPMRAAGDTTAAMAAALEAVVDGAITPGEYERLARLVDIFRKTLETADLEAWVATLEAAGGSKR